MISLKVSASSSLTYPGVVENPGVLAADAPVEDLRVHLVDAVSGVRPSVGLAGETMDTITTPIEPIVTVNRYWNISYGSSPGKIVQHTDRAEWTDRKRLLVYTCMKWK